jgi:hypothetical protein
MAAITTAAIGIAVAGASMYMGEAQKKKAQKQMREYERQDIAEGTSPYENIQVSTLGSDLMREENQLASANAYDVLGLSGDRAIVGGVGKVVSGTNNLNRVAQKELDDQKLKRDYAIAGDETALRSMREQRDNQNIAAISSQIAAGNQGVQNGMMGMASGLAAAGRGYQLNKTNAIADKIAQQAAMTFVTGGSPQALSETLPQINNSGATFPQQQVDYQSPTNPFNSAPWKNPNSFFETDKFNPFASMYKYQN